MQKNEKIKQVRKYLKKYKLLKKELTARRNEFEEYLTEIYNPIRGIVIDGLPKTIGGMSDPTGNSVANINQKVFDTKSKKIHDLESEILEIELAINELDYSERYVLHMLYIVGIKLDDLCEYTSYAKTQNRSYEVKGIKQIISRNLLPKAIPTEIEQK